MIALHAGAAPFGRIVQLLVEVLAVLTGKPRNTRHRIPLGTSSVTA